MNEPNTDFASVFVCARTYNYLITKLALIFQLIEMNRGEQKITDSNVHTHTQKNTFIFRSLFISSASQCYYLQSSSRAQKRKQKIQK